MKKLAIIMIIMALAWNSNAQFKVGAEYRLRSEFKDGQKTLSDSTTSPAFVSSQRIRLNIGYTSDKLELFVAMQDIRTWGEIPHKTDVPSLGIHQAYVRYKINNNFAVKLGRQTLIYDNKYVLGVKNWNNVSVAHDVALMQYKVEKTEAHIAFANSNKKEVTFESDYDLNFYKYLSIFWVKHKFSDNLNVSLLNFYEGRQKTDTINTIYTRGTIGSFVNYKAGNFALSFAPYYQFGKSKNGDKVSAYFIHFEPSYKIIDPLKISIGIDYFSGDDAENDNGEANTFSNSYGDGHGYYGYMDYFTNIEKNTNNGGLSDMFLKVTYNLNEKMTLHAAYHNFSLTNNIIDTLSNPGVVQMADKQLGNEIDVYWKYKFYKNSSLTIGYSTMFATNSMEILKGGDSDKMQQWLFLSVQFKPTLFNSENK